MHRRIMGGPQGNRMGQQFPGWVRYPETPGGIARASMLVRGSGPLNQPRRKPAGHAADRNKCTLQARVILTPIRSPKANSYAERLVKTVRSEILDWTLIHGRRHLYRVLRTYASHYNAQRPHRGLDLSAPENPSPIAPVDEVPRDRAPGSHRRAHP